MSDDNDAGARVQALREFAAESRVLPILVQFDPDPDAMASALAVRTLLDRSESASPIVTLGQVTRPENRRMAQLLDLKVTPITEDELHGFDRVVAVDVQPIVSSPPVFAVIDHHPERHGYDAVLKDVRSDVGAASTILTEYLCAAGEDRINSRLATALLYGIRTDTDLLLRGAVSADVKAYAFLQDRADQVLLRRIGRPSVSLSVMQSLGRALAGVRTRAGLAAAFMGELSPEESHIAPSLADIILALEGVSLSAAATILEGELVLNLRSVGEGTGAGAVARALAEVEGKGGGHSAMARVALSTRGLDDLPLEVGHADTTDRILELVATAAERAQDEEPVEKRAQRMPSDQL